jgi:arginine deiminase
MTSQNTVSSTYGVHSEVGRLRKVLVCAPGLAHRRLTPPTPTTCCSTT